MTVLRQPTRLGTGVDRSRGEAGSPPRRSFSIVAPGRASLRVWNSSVARMMVSEMVIITEDYPES